VFARIAGADGEVDAYELQTILNTMFLKGFFVLRCNFIVIQLLLARKS